MRKVHPGKPGEGGGDHHKGFKEKRLEGGRGLLNRKSAAHWGSLWYNISRQKHVKCKCNLKGSPSNSLKKGP